MFPSDCLPWPARNGSFVIDGPVPPEKIPDACAALVEERNHLARPCARGEQSGRARWVPGCPVRLLGGGVGGNCMLLLTPEPASWCLWLEASSNLRNVNLASFAEVDMSDDPAESFSQRAKQKSAGGVMIAYSPKDNAQRRSNPMWSPKTMRSRRVGPSADGLILREE